MSIKIDKVIKSKRKTFSLEITQDARLIVRAPFGASLGLIQDIVSQKINWIKKKKSQMNLRKKKPKKFIEGELFLYLGQKYPLKLKSQKIALDLNKNFNLSASEIKNAKEIFTNWYKKEAKIIIQDRVDYYAELNKLKYQKIRITSAKKRWGSCSANNNLNFSWRLVMAPMEIVDYVVVHELAHIKEKNHSSKFWQVVERIMPDYKQRRKWLKENGHLLNL